MPNIIVQQRATTVFNIKDYGAQGNGSTDDTAAITAAITAASVNGGQVFFPQGTYVTGKQLLYPKVSFRGAGRETTTLQLKAGTNDDLLQGSVTGYVNGSNGYTGTTTLVNVNSSYATGVIGGVSDFSIFDLTLDGNRANQTAGTGIVIRLYGYDFTIHTVNIRNGYAGGAIFDWNGNNGAGGGTGSAAGTITAFSGQATNSDLECSMIDVKINNNGGIGLEWGIHDSRHVGVYSFFNDSHGVHIGKNAPGLLCSNGHVWGPKQTVSAVGYLIEAGYCQFANCVAEGSDTANVVLCASTFVWSGGHLYGAGQYHVTGFQIGQPAGVTPYAGQGLVSAGVTLNNYVGGLMFDSQLTLCNGVNGAINFANDAGNNSIRANIYLSSGTDSIGTYSGKAYSGTINVYTSYDLLVGGITPDGTIPLSGGSRIALNSANALTVTNRTNDVFNVNSFYNQLQVLQNMSFNMYSGAYGTPAFQIAPANSFNLQWNNNDTYLGRQAAGLVKSNGAFMAGSNLGAATLVNGSTIIHFGSQANGKVVVTSASAVTGLIMQSTSNDGYITTIVNKGGFALTFATSGTSNVADGTADVIPANAARTYIYDASTSLWYPCR